MNDEYPPVSPDRVPTLTEVLEFGVAGAVLQQPPTVASADEAAASLQGADEAHESGEPLVVPVTEATPPPASQAEPGPQAAQAQAVVPDPQAEATPEPAHVEDTPGAATLPGPVAVPSAAAAPDGFDAQALVGQVLAELQPRIDMLLESRLREALAPALARVADGLIRETRDELSAALRDLVADAVARAQERHNERF